MDGPWEDDVVMSGALLTPSLLEELDRDGNRSVRRGSRSSARKGSRRHSCPPMTGPRKAVHSCETAGCEAGSSTPPVLSFPVGRGYAKNDVIATDRPHSRALRDPTSAPTSVPPSSSTSSLPQTHEAVYIKGSGRRRGLGVFTSIDLPLKHKIIVEEAFLSCVHWGQRRGARTVGREWVKLSRTRKEMLIDRFRKLRDIPIDGELDRRQVRKLDRFIDEYGFWEPARTNAHIYMLASHINHACVSCANAEQWTDSREPHAITVQLVKPLEAGAEVFINYNRPGLSFRCAVCSPHGIKGCFRAVGDSLMRWTPAGMVGTGRGCFGRDTKVYDQWQIHGSEASTTRERPSGKRPAIGHRPVNSVEELDGSAPAPSHASPAARRRGFRRALRFLAGLLPNTDRPTKPTKPAKSRRR